MGWFQFILFLASQSKFNESTQSFLANQRINVIKKNLLSLYFTEQCSLIIYKNSRNHINTYLRYTNIIQLYPGLLISILYIIPLKDVQHAFGVLKTNGLGHGGRYLSIFFIKTVLLYNLLSATPLDVSEKISLKRGRWGRRSFFNFHFNFKKKKKILRGC